MPQQSKRLAVLLLIVARACPIGAKGNASIASGPVSSRAIDPGVKYLIFPQGSNVQLVYCLTIGSLSKPEGMFTLGVTAGLAYELPYRRIGPFKRAAEAHYHGRGNRRELYRKLEKVLETQKKDGRGCILWALCQAGKRNRQRKAHERMSFLEEILHSVFTYPSDKESTDTDTQRSREEMLLDVEYEFAYSTQDECHKLFRACPRLFF